MPIEIKKGSATERAKAARKKFENGSSETKKLNLKVIRNKDLLWNLQTPDGKSFGDVSYDVYKAAQNGTIEKYKPKNDWEKRVIEEYRNHPGFSLITNTGVNLGQVTYDGIKSLENNTIDSYTPKKGESETFKKYNDYLNLQAVNIPLDDGSSLSMTYGTMKKIDDYFEKNKSNASARDTISDLIDSLDLQDVDRQDALTYAEIKAKELPEKPKPKKKKDNFFQWAGKNAMAGVANFNKSFYSTADWLLPTEFLGKYDVVSWANNQATEDKNYWNSAADKSSKSLGGGFEFAGQVLRGAVEAAPDMVLAYFVPVGGLATQGTKAVSSLKAASSIGNAALKGSTLKSTATAVAKELASNPVYWSSFIQTVGVEYEDAIARGANEWEATASSMLSSLINAGVEMGGMQKLPEAVKKGGKQVVLDWVKSSLEEGQEEVVQGIITQSVAKLIYDKNKEVVSLTDKDAIINPGRMAEEFVMGASVGGVLGGLTIAGNNAANRYNISQLGKESREFSDTIITIGLKNPIDSESYKNAEKLSKKDKLSDYDIGKQYILNAEQMKKNKALAEVDLEESEISTGTDADTSTDAVGKVATPEERNIFTGELDEISSTEMPEVKVGDGFIEKKTSNRFEIVERDDTTTTIKITTPKNKVTIRTMPNNGADTLLVDDQFTQVESTVNTSATVDEQSITNVFNTITSGKVTSNNIDSIIKNPQLKSAFEQLSGVKVSGTTAEQRALIKNWLNNSSNVESLKLKNAGLTTAHAKVNSLLENPVSANVRSIIRNEALTKAFESLTGVTLSGDMDTRRAIVRENAELARTNFAKAMSVSGVNVNNLTRTVGNTAKNTSAKVTTETAKAKETTGTETVSNTEVDESDAQVTAVVDAINETIVPGGKEELITALAKSGRRADTITLAKTLRKAYKNKGTLGKMAKYFEDGGKKVISAIESTIDTTTAKDTTKSTSEKQTETTSQETKASENVEKNTETKTPETDTSKTIAEKIRNVEEKIRAKVQQANDTIEQINGIQTLKQQLSDKTITPRQYENEIRKDSRYRELDDEIIALEKELDSLKNELESSKKVTSADDVDNALDNRQTTETAKPESEKTTDTKTKPTPKNVTMAKDGYEVYGEDAILLAEELNLTPTKKVINGVETDVLIVPETLLDEDVEDDSFASNELRASLSSMGSAFFGNEKVTAEEFEEMLEDGSYKEHQGYKDYVKSIVNVYTQSRGITKLSESNRAEIEKQIEGIIKVGIAAKKAGYDIFDDGNVRDIKDSKKRLLFSSLEPNSDYITSSDISTICDKRKNFAEIYDAIVKLEESRGVPADKRFFSNVDNYFILHKLMAEKGLTIPCEECYVESMRKNLAPMANAFIELVTETDSKNKTNAQLYHQEGKDKGNVKKNNAKLRASVRGMYDSATGSEIVKNHSPISVDNLTIEMLTTADGLAQLKLQAPYLYEAFNSFYGQSKPKMPKQATPFRPGELIALMTDSKGKIKKGLVDKIVSTGGFRLQSYSDFQIENFTDVLQTIFEASMLGLNGHAYTKVPAFLETTKGTNLKRNISIFMYEDNGQWVLDKKNSFPMELNDIYALVASDESGNTSIIAVSQNEDMSAWIMANDNVGYGIPFHKSGLKMDVVRARVVKTPDGREVLGYANQKDHTAQQSEVYKKTLSEKKKVNTKVKQPIDIYKFWDFENKDNLSKKELIEKNIKRYIDECNKRNYRPKFRDYVMGNESILDNVLRYAKELGFVSQDATIDDISFEYDEYRIPYGYYKFLGDFGMFKADGTATPIETLSLENYDFDGAVEFFKDSEKLRTNELLQQFENGQVREQYRKMIENGDLTIEQLSDILKKKREAVAMSVVDDFRASLSSYAPTFYSHMAKTIDGMKDGKHGANSVVSYLKGKGVKNEEIKWSGIEEFLEGKKSVTKADLQKFVAGNQLEIEETIFEGGVSTTLEHQHDWRTGAETKDFDVMRGGDLYDTLTWNKSENVWESDELGYTFSSEESIRNYYGVNENGTRWGKYKLKGGKNYREITFKLPTSTYTNAGMQTHWGSNAKGILAHARIQDFKVNGKKMLFIEEIQSDWHNEGHRVGYLSKGQKNYQDIRNESADAFREFCESDTMQSIANRLEKNGYGNVPTIFADLIDGNQSAYDTIIDAIGQLTSKEKDFIENAVREETKRKGQFKDAQFGRTVPDAPFRENYHEYVLKSLIRMAAEQGYDSIGWTTADIQSERWSDDFAEGYRIEYDQDMPKFLNKYGKKWGTKVGTTKLSNGVLGLNKNEIWSMPITESMKDSVLYEGQTLYSLEKEGNKNEKGTGIRNDLLLKNSRWGHNEDSRKQTERISYFKRKNKGRNETERRIFAKELLEQGQTEEIIDRRHKYIRIKPEAYNDDMLSIVEEAKKKGKDVEFFIGHAQIKFDNKRKYLVNGIKTGESKILIQYDDVLPPQVIYLHEFGHSEWKTPEMQKVKDEILNSLSENDKKKILSQERYQRYVKVYKGNMDIVWEEFVVDTLSGMNEYTERFIDTVNEYWYGNETVEGYNPATYAESIDAGGKQIDTEYLKAVENGDIETAQKMVEEYAKKAGYSVKAYHGTTSKFTVFDKSKQGSKNGSVLGNAFYFSSDESMADEWGGRDKTMSVFLKLQNPINVDSAITEDMLRAYQALPGRDINELEDFYNSYMKKSYPTFEDYLKVYEENSKRVSEIDTKSVGSWIGAMNTKGDSNNNSTNLLKGFGIDGIISEHKRSRNFPDWIEYAVFDENQIKSADTIVYDDNGNIIPLSERFNPENDDIRYSVTEVDNDADTLDTQKKIERIAKEIESHEELIAVAKQNTQEFVKKIRENKSLKKRLHNAKRQMLLSPNPIVNAAKVGKVTKDILKEMDSTLKASELKDEVMSIYNEYFAEIKASKSVESKVQQANETMLKRFTDLAVDIADSSEVYTESEEYLMLKAYLKNTAIKVPDYVKSDVHYAEFRKSHMGSFKLTNDGLDIDVAYLELCEMFPGVFDTDVANLADQLLEIADKLESLRPYAYNPNTGYMQESIDHIVYRFVSEADGIATMPKTKAQKIAEKAAYDKDMAIEKEKASFEQKFEKHKKESEAKIRKLQKKVDDIKYARFWEKHLDKEEKANAIKEMRERQKVAILKSKIRNIVSNMKKNLDKSEKTGGYPKELVKTVAEVCSVLDFHTDKTTDKDGNPTKTSLKLDALKMEYDALKNNENYDFQSEFDEALSIEINKLHEKVKGKRVIDLNAFDLAELKDILSEISHRLSIATKQIGKEKAKENAMVGSEIIDSLNSRSDVIKADQKQLLKEAKLVGQQGKSIVFNPHRINEMIAGYDKNSAWWELYDGINRGSRKASKFVMDATMPFDELTDGGGNEIAFYNFRTKNVNTGIKYIDGSDVVVPKSIVCELVMMWDRKQGRTHLESGGAKIPNMNLYNKGKTTVAITDSGRRTVPITQTDIDRLKTMLDSYDKAWIEKAHHLFNNVSKEAINSTSMELIGRELAKTENYIRMYVDQDFIRREIDGRKDDATLESHGSLKETVPNAKQPIVLRGLHENVYDNIDFTSKYYGLAIPIRNFNKVYNIVISDGVNRNSVKELIGQKFGSSIRSNVVEQLIRDLQSPRPRSLEPFSKIRGKWLGATFWGNISSTLKQTTSYWTASAILSEDSLVKGLAHFVQHPKRTRVEISKHSGTLYKRSQGLSTTELGDRANSKRLAGASNQVTKLINKYAPILRKIPEGIRPGNWLQSMDCNVAAALWEACKIETSKTMDISDERYMQAVTDLYERVIEETQSNYDLAHRPEALKNSNVIMRTITMFQTDNLQQTGIMYSAFNDYKTKSESYKKDTSSDNKKSLDDAKKRLSKAIRSRIYSSVWLALMCVLKDMLLRKFTPYIDDEEKEITARSILERMRLGIAEDMFSVTVPIGGELILSAKDTFDNGYDFITEPSFETIQDFIEATSKIYDAVSDDESNVEKIKEALVDAIPAISNFTGIPAKNISDLFGSITGYAGDVKEKKFAHNITDYISSFYSHGDLAKYIMSGDVEKENELLEYFSANGKEVSKGTLTKEIKPAYVQMYVNSPEKLNNIKAKLVGDYGYSLQTIGEWTIDEYMDNVVENPEYAEEIKEAVSKRNKWGSEAIRKLIKSRYKKAYKEEDEKETKALRDALEKSADIPNSILSKWESEADEEIEETKEKREKELKSLG